MPRTVGILISMAATLASVGLASSNNATGEPGPSPSVQRIPVPSPALAVQASVAANTGAATIHWDRFYDASGNPLPGEPQDNVGAESLYFKKYSVTDTLYGCPKSEVPNPTPADCRPAFTFLDGSTRVGMDPLGTYIYEVDGTSLRRHNTSTGTFTNYTISNGNTCCMTDGNFLYVPVSNVVYKYTLTGTLVNSTTLNITPLQYAFSVANDTVWCGTNSTTLNGYACSKFIGGSITQDATWSLGAGAGSGVIVCWDGTYYYAGWSGSSSDTFKRYNADRTVSASGTINIDPRSVMCRKVARPLMIVSTDDEYFRAQLVETLKVASGGVLDRIGTYSVQDNATFPATEWYNDGCRVILEFSGGFMPGSPTLVGESLATFVDRGGRVVTAMWADAPGNLAGRYVTQYMPFTMQSPPGVGDSMGTVHDPLHPIMDGVTEIAVTNYVTGNTHSTLRSPNCVCLAEWSSANRSVVAYLDSADVRLASVGYVPIKGYSHATGQWARLLANAILWVWPGTPAVTVTAPATGNVWFVGESRDITWTAANGPIIRDSIVYSYDSGATWSFLDKYTGSRTSCTWDPIPNRPSTSCYVRVFSWNAAGSASGLSGKFEIRVPLHDVGVTDIIQPGNTIDSGATVVPTAEVQNFGEVEEAVPIRFSIGGFYMQDTSVTIGPGATDTVTFLSWVVSQVGTHAVRCSTMLRADEDDSNDLCVDTVVVPSPGGIEQPEDNALPLAFALYQSCPNPLASGAALPYALPRPARMEMRIYDVAGALVRRLVEGVQPAGYRRAYWNRRDDRGRRAAPGVYYCRFKADDFLATQKLVVRR
jgi:hypothetical protein